VFRLLLGFKGCSTHQAEEMYIKNIAALLYRLHDEFHGADSGLCYVFQSDMNAANRSETR
jgi:hypothetical protein